MNSAISYLRPHYSAIVKCILFFLFSGTHFLFFFVFLISVSSLSHHFSALSLSLYSTSLPPNPWLTVNDHPNHKPMVDLWLTPNQPPTIIATAQGDRTVAAHDKQRPHGHSRDLNQPTATHAIWSHPRQSTVIWTHPWPSTATHNDLNPTHDEPRPPPTHGNLNPTPIWSLQADLEREEKLSLWEKERRERDGSTSGFAGGDNGGGFFFLFLFCLFFLLWLVVVGGCGCGGFFLLWFFFSFFLSGGYQWRGQNFT